MPTHSDRSRCLWCWQLVIRPSSKGIKIATAVLTFALSGACSLETCRAAEPGVQARNEKGVVQQAQFGPGEATPAARRRCPRTGQVNFSMGSTYLSVRRDIISGISLPDKTFPLDWVCSDGPFEVRRIFIVPSVTHSGREFYHSWKFEKRMPILIEIGIQGIIKNTLAQIYTKLLEEKGFAESPSADFETVSVPANTFYASKAIPSGRNDHLIIRCSKITLGAGSHLCDAHFRYLNLDITYKFDGAVVKLDDWVALDQRVHSFVRELVVK